MDFYVLWQNILNFLKTAGLSLLWVVLALIVGSLAIKWALVTLRSVLSKSKMDRIAINFIVSVVKFILIITLVIILADIAKINTTSFVAILGAAGLAISLALQDSLSNLANGVILIFNKPFKEGDFVEINNTSGKVKTIRLMVTELETVDKKEITIPNSQITRANIINYDTNPQRRVDLTVGVGFGTDIDKARDVINQLIANDTRILKELDAVVKVAEIGQSSIKLVIKFYVETSNYWDCFYDFNENLIKAFRENQIEIPFNQLDITLKSYLKSE